MIKFSKMHSLGNDFMVIDGVRQHIHLTKQQIQQWSNRHTGIGFDQLLLVEESSKADFRYRIFNADGGEVSQCGNGARCLAQFLHLEKLTEKKSILVETANGLLELHHNNDGLITVDLGIPHFAPAGIPFLADAQQPFYMLATPHGTVEAVILSIGNPHCILFVEDVDTAPVEQLGHALCHHEKFPQQTNVEFVQIIDEKNIKLRVFERGVGETQACGSGACAAVIAGRLNSLLDTPVNVEQLGGNLIVDWLGENSSVFLTGDTHFVFTGYV